MFGVAPAFFFSLYGTHFTVDDYIAGLKLLPKAGFSGYQAEIFYEDNLGEWESRAYEIKEAADANGLAISQMDVHFLIDSCNTDSTLFSEREIPLFSRVAEVCRKLGTDVMTIPIGKYDTSSLDNSETYASRWTQFKRKISLYCRIAEDCEMRVGMEIVPGSILGNTDGLLRLIEETGCINLGYNFDTGHAWAAKEAIAFIPSKLKGRIWGTHLKDNFSNEDLALPPGQGSVPWQDLAGMLKSSGYTGPTDLEINSASPEDTLGDYVAGREFLNDILKSDLSLIKTE